MQKDIYKNKLAQEHGVVLLITLMILTVMMVSVLALSRVIIGEVKITRNADNAINAYYAAESGIEKGLYAIKKSGINDSYANYLALDQDSCAICGTQSYVFDQTSTTKASFEATDISTTTFASVDLIDPGADISAISGQFNCYQIDWEIDGCFPTHAADRIEVSHASLNPGFTDSDTFKFTATCNCSYGNNQCDSITRSEIDQDKFYHFTFRPLDNTVNLLTFSAYKDSSNCPNSDSIIPSEATLRVTGKYRRSTYTITATRPIFNQVSGLFSHVIFSEQEINKGL